MVRSGVPGVAQSPSVLCEEEAEDSEEEAGDFEPENSAGMGEGAPDRLAEYSCATDGGAALLSPPLYGNGSLLVHGMSSLRGAVAENASTDTDADAQFSAKTVRLHE